MDNMEKMKAVGLTDFFIFHILCIYFFFVYISSFSVISEISNISLFPVFCNIFSTFIFSMFFSFSWFHCTALISSQNSYFPLFSHFPVFSNLQPFLNLYIFSESFIPLLFSCIFGGVCGFLHFYVFHGFSTSDFSCSVSDLWLLIPTPSFLSACTSIHDFGPLISNVWFMTSDFWPRSSFLISCSWLLKRLIYDFRVVVSYLRFMMPNFGLPIRELICLDSCSLVSGPRPRISDLWHSPLISLLIPDFRFMKSMISGLRLPGLDPGTLISDFLIFDIGFLISHYFHDFWYPISETHDSWFPIYEGRPSRFLRAGRIDFWGQTELIFWWQTELIFEGRPNWFLRADRRIWAPTQKSNRAPWCTYLSHAGFLFCNLKNRPLKKPKDSGQPPRTRCKMEHSPFFPFFFYRNAILTHSRFLAI